MMFGAPQMGQGSYFDTFFCSQKSGVGFIACRGVQRVLSLLFAPGAQRNWGWDCSPVGFDGVFSALRILRRFASQTPC